MTSPRIYTVYFDGACRAWRTEIAQYQRQRGAEAIAWVDVCGCDDPALGRESIEPWCRVDSSAKRRARLLRTGYVADAHPLPDSDAPLP